MAMEILNVGFESKNEMLIFLYVKVNMDLFDPVLQCSLIALELSWNEMLGIHMLTDALIMTILFRKEAAYIGWEENIIVIDDLSRK